jgi:hypothetical protein
MSRPRPFTFFPIQFSVIITPLGATYPELLRMALNNLQIHEQIMRELDVPDRTYDGLSFSHLKLTLT